MIIKRYKVGFLTLSAQKMAYVTNRLQKGKRWQRLCLEIVFELASGISSTHTELQGLLVAFAARFMTAVSALIFAV